MGTQASRSFLGGELVKRVNREDSVAHLPLSVRATKKDAAL